MTTATSTCKAILRSATQAHWAKAGLWRQTLTCSSGGAIDFDEEAEPEIMDDVDDAEGGEDPDVDDNIVVSGDVGAAAAVKDKAKNSVDAEKAKRVPNENRTTTPYMTKYEKARVLGTRALQIR